MATLLEQLSYLNDTKELIRQSIQNKGVDVPSRTTFRQYPSKIDEIIADPAVWSVNEQGVFTDVSARKTLSVPSEIDGNLVSNTFNITNDLAGSRMSINVREFIIPDYFLTAYLGRLLNFTNAYNAQFERIYCGATSIPEWGNCERLRYIKELDIPNDTGTLPFSALNVDNVSNTLYINAPKVDRWLTKIGTANNPVNLTINMPAITIAGNDTQYQGTALGYCIGEWEFPAATELRWVQRPIGEQTMKLPAITQQTVNTCFNLGSDTGILHLYLGPNMSRCDCAANWVTYASQIDIHIPAGDTTTKATLDAAGVAYTQDYVI